MKLKPAHFLHTDINQYLDTQAHPVTCISCLQCIKPKSRPLSYKYNPKMESMSMSAYAPSTRVDNK